MEKELTGEIKAELSGKPVEDRRKALTDLHQTGYNIKPYLEEMLKCSDGIHCGPEDNGFKSTHFANDNLVLYTLKGGKISFIYQILPNGKYKPWP